MQLLAHEVNEDKLDELVNDIHKNDENPPSDEVKKEEKESILRSVQGHLHWRSSLPVSEQVALANVPVISTPDSDTKIPAVGDVNQPSNESGQTSSTDFVPTDVTEQNTEQNL